jgi:hypothetical protein
VMKCSEWKWSAICTALATESYDARDFLRGCWTICLCKDGSYLYPLTCYLVVIVAPRSITPTRLESRLRIVTGQSWLGGRNGGRGGGRERGRRLRDVPTPYSILRLECLLPVQLHFVLLTPYSA